MRRVVRKDLLATHHAFHVVRDTDPITWDQLDCIAELCSNQQKFCSWPFPRVKEGQKDVPTPAQKWLLDLIVKKSLAGQRLFDSNIGKYLRKQIGSKFREDVQTIVFAVGYLRQRSQLMGMFGPLISMLGTCKDIEDLNLQVSAMQLLSEPIFQDGNDPAGLILSGEKVVALPEWMSPGGSYQLVRGDKADLEIWEVQAMCGFVESKMDVSNRNLQGYWKMGKEVVDRCKWDDFVAFLSRQRLGVQDFLPEKIASLELGGNTFRASPVESSKMVQKSEKTTPSKIGESYA